MNDEQAEKMIHLLEEILTWTRLDGVQKAKSTLEALLTNDVERIIYQNSDGRTSREIAQIAGISHGTVVRYWRRWSMYGIVEEVRSQGGSRYRRVFSLPDFGIEVPQVRANEAIPENREQSAQSNISTED